jgi:hypothetical protein
MSERSLIELIFLFSKCYVAVRFLKREDEINNERKITNET